MTNELILIRYGELSLKSSYVRRRFITTLTQNITRVFHSKNIPCSLKKEWGRLYLYTDDIPSSITLLQKTFGITSVSPAVQTTDNLREISQQAIHLIKTRVDAKKSFALRVTRTGTHRYTSQDAAVAIGEDIRKTTHASVDLTHPDVEIFIEIRGSSAYLFFGKLRGYGGLPVGTQGTVVALIDTPHSLLAAWYLMRRGCHVVFVPTNNSLIDDINVFCGHWNIISPSICSVNQKEVVSGIQNVLVKAHGSALVMGHTFFDSKTLSQIVELKKQVGYPVLSPLIGLNEQELLKKYGEVGLSE